MHNLVTLVIIAAALNYLPRIVRRLHAAITCFIVVDGKDITVTDGDSITIAGRRCRVIGHDSPEWDQPQGPAARAALREIISGQCIVIPLSRDIYDRMLVHVFTAHGLASWRMVQRGHGFAEVWWLLPTMLAARWRRRGMWGTRHLTRPDIWRLGNPLRGRNRS